VRGNWITSCSLARSFSILLSIPLAILRILDPLIRPGVVYTIPVSASVPVSIISFFLHFRLSILTVHTPLATASLGREWLGSLMGKSHLRLFLPHSASSFPLPYDPNLFVGPLSIVLVFLYLSCRSQLCLSSG